MYVNAGNTRPSTCLYATYFCSTLNVSSEKLEKEMCRMQNRSMPSFSNPCSLGSWYHTLPSTSDVMTAAPSLAVTNSLLRIVTLYCLPSTHLKCCHVEWQPPTPYCFSANSVLSSTSELECFVLSCSPQRGLARHADASASVVTGAFPS